MSSDAKREANSRYLRKMDSLSLRMPKGMKEQIKDAAAERGTSTNQFILNCIWGELERSKDRPKE